MNIDYENPWIYRNRPFSSDDIDDFYGFVYNITNLQNQRQYIGRKYFWSHRKPPGKKRRVKKNLTGKNTMGLVRNLKKTLNDWVDKILVELSCHYIKHLAKQTSRKQDNSSSTESLPNPLTQEDLPTTIATSSAGTSEKTIMMETEEIVADVRQWAIDKVQEYNGKGIERIYDQMALMAEFDEWFDPQEDLEVISLDEISKDQYDDFVDYMKD